MLILHWIIRFIFKYDMVNISCWNISKNRLKLSKPKVFGKLQTSTFSEMGDADFLNLQARRKALEKNITTLSREEFERYKKEINA